MKYVFRILYLIFGIMGLAFFALGLIFGLKEWNFEAIAVETTGIVKLVDSYRNSDGDLRYRILVGYEIDGDYHEQELDQYSSSISEGDRITVKYNPDKPDNISTGNNYVLSFVFGGIGFVFLGVVVAMMLFSSRKSRENDWLRTYGQEITARITNVTVNMNIQYNGNNAYNVRCSWQNPQTGELFLFKGKNLYFDPQPIIDSRGIRTLSVYMDQDNPKRYLVDQSPIEDNVVSL